MVSKFKCKLLLNFLLSPTYDAVVSPACLAALGLWSLLIQWGLVISTPIFTSVLFPSIPYTKHWGQCAKAKQFYSSYPLVFHLKESLGSHLFDKSSIESYGPMNIILFYLMYELLRVHLFVGCQQIFIFVHQMTNCILNFKEIWKFCPIFSKTTTFTKRNPQSGVSLHIFIHILECDLLKGR